MIFCSLTTPLDVSVTAGYRSGETRVHHILISLMMTERLEQRYSIKFCRKLGDTQMETIHKIQKVFGNDAMGVTQRVVQPL
jgi:hypothetical protein